MKSVLHIQIIGILVWANGIWEEMRSRADCGLVISGFNTYV